MEEVYEDPNKKVDKPSKIWYLLPIFLGLVGGLVFYFLIKNKDKKMAELGLVLGVILSFVYGIILLPISILTYYGLFAPTGFLGPTARGFTEIQVANPWELKSNGDLTLRLESSSDNDVVIRRILVENKEVTSPNLPLKLSKGEPSVISFSGGPEGVAGNGYSVTVSIEYYLEANPQKSYKSEGIVTGKYT